MPDLRPLVPVSQRTKAALYALRDLQSTDLFAFREVVDRGLVPGARVLDFGCGAGRSSRFLGDLGKTVVGVDANPYMIDRARARQVPGTFLHVEAGCILPFPDQAFDAFFSSWVILEQGSPDSIVRCLRELHRVTRDRGIGVVIANTDEFYRRDWVSCDVDYPENAGPLSPGQQVKVRLLSEGLEITDYFWSDENYRNFFRQAGFTVAQALRPIGSESDPVPWKDELAYAPFVIYQLAKVVPS